MVHRRSMALADYGKLELWQKTEALQRHKMQSQLPTLQYGRNNPTQDLGSQSFQGLHMGMCILE